MITADFRWPFHLVGLIFERRHPVPSTTSDSSTGYGPARFWAVDLHVHTPASLDVQEQASKYGASTPEEIVAAAVAAKLDAIAITDHNTVDWCERVALAAVGHPLVVMPGAEISTSEGHLLAVWEEGTPVPQIEEVLVMLGLGHAKRGKLDIAAQGGIVETARIIAESGGVAIAAHADRDKGLLKISVKARVRDTLLDPALSAVEIVDPATATQIQNQVGNVRELACVRGSDTMLSGQSSHVLAGIGSRRTWIKASRPDLRGLRHALEDPELRVRIGEPLPPTHMIIKSVRVTGGFFDGQVFTFSPDLNCLLGGTGTGKSLLIELIRFVLDSQPSAEDFPHVRREVDSRLDKALGMNATVELLVQRGAAEFTVSRVYCGESSPGPEVTSAVNAASFDEGLIPIRAFSQGEVIEYARAPVGRMALIDAALDLTDLAAEEAAIVQKLRINGEQITGLRAELNQTKERLEGLPEIGEKLGKLTEFFNADIIKEQQKWSREKARLGKLGDIAELSAAPVIRKPAAFNHVVENESNAALYACAVAAYGSLHAAIDQANGILDASYQKARQELSDVATEWKSRNGQFSVQFAAELAKIDTDRKGLGPLKKALVDLQVAKTELEDAADRVRDVVEPALVAAMGERESLIDRLVTLRRERRDRRSGRIKDLNRLMQGVVRIKLAKDSDTSGYLRDLDALVTGSRIKKEFLRALCRDSSPIRLVRSYLDGDPEGAAKALDLDSGLMAKLFDWVAERGVENEFLGLQGIDTPDALSVEFRKEGLTEYVAIEQLAHGQKCTAILIIAMADGDEPLIIDQPEDALHAPWIEEYLVDRLRELRGDRQYIFATRSAGLVVSADAEMIITLTAGARSGSVESSGSLERHELNRLALYHLEGGALPFKRRTRKLAPSVV